MFVRAKFQINGVKKFKAWDGSWAWTVYLSPVTGDPLYGKATPSGSIEMTIANPDAAAKFEEHLGEAIFVDFTKTVSASVITQSHSE